MQDCPGKYENCLGKCIDHAGPSLKKEAEEFHGAELAELYWITCLIVQFMLSLIWISTNKKKKISSSLHCCSAEQELKFDADRCAQFFLIVSSGSYYFRLYEWGRGLHNSIRYGHVYSLSPASSLWMSLLCKSNCCGGCVKSLVTLRGIIFGQWDKRTLRKRNSGSSCLETRI